MLFKNFKQSLCFYFITDDMAPSLTPLDQVKIAIKAGATIIQYRNKNYSSVFFSEAVSIAEICKTNSIPLLINDNILLAKAVEANGVHLGQKDESPAIAREILGPDAIIGLSVSNQDQLRKSDLRNCDYIGTGPVFPTKTKKDIKPVCGLAGLKEMVLKSKLPTVAIGGISNKNAAACIQQGAAGVAVISAISRDINPLTSALKTGRACDCQPRKKLAAAWDDEFHLIDILIKQISHKNDATRVIRVPVGDDACLLNGIENPVITTDSQIEGVHFKLQWQTPEEIGRKAVSITFSDLAASYAKPVALFVNFSIPPNLPEAMIKRFYSGINQALRQYGGCLGGGNISSSKCLALDLFAIGNGTEKIFPIRSKAVPGEKIYCTGPLGLARAGLLALKNHDFSFPRLIDKFINPKARFDAARILADFNVECVTDISDGLAGDAKNIAKASNITIEFDQPLACVNSELIQFCRLYKQNPTKIALEGGEDYELLFSCPPKLFDKIVKVLPTAFLVGRCMPYKNTWLANLPIGLKSYQHGKK